MVINYYSIFSFCREEKVKGVGRERERQEGRGETRMLESEKSPQHSWLSIGVHSIWLILTSYFILQKFNLSSFQCFLHLFLGLKSVAALLQCKNLGMDSTLQLIYSQCLLGSLLDSMLETAIAYRTCAHAPLCELMPPPDTSIVMELSI